MTRYRPLPWPVRPAGCRIRYRDTWRPRWLPRPLWAVLTRRTVLRLVAWAVVLLLAAAVPVNAGDETCRSEPESQWAPAGWVCPPHYGIGTASTWQGPGAATNGCSHAIRDTTGCPAIAVRSLTTGLVIQVVPTEWCHCWVGVTGPGGETERLVDLGPELVAALGLPGPGLWPVEVWPAADPTAADRSPAPAMPDTATGGGPR